VAAHDVDADAAEQQPTDVSSVRTSDVDDVGEHQAEHGRAEYSGGPKRSAKLASGGASTVS
jgi:hypothetical protein